LLIRHGQTDWNVEGRWQGTIPIALNAEGWSQARSLAEHLRGRPIGSVISSDLPRAYETATAVAEACGLPAQPDVRLREFDMGIFQGHTRAQIETQFAAEWAAFRADYWDYPIPQGETRRQLQDRVYAAWQDFVAGGSGPEGVLVSHGGSIRMLLMRLFPTDDRAQHMHIDNTSVTTVERDGEGWRLVEVNVVDHLGPPLDEEGEASA
jgi:probable phosphoglycerate mutase